MPFDPSSIPIYNSAPDSSAIFNINSWSPFLLGLAPIRMMMGWGSFNRNQMKDFPSGKGRDRVNDFAPQRMDAPGKLHVNGLIFNDALEWIDQNWKFRSECAASNGRKPRIQFPERKISRLYCAGRIGARPFPHQGFGNQLLETSHFIPIND